MANTVRDLIQRHEGFRSKPYQDSVGILTIGWGRNLEDVGISNDEAMLMLDNDISKAMDGCQVFPWFSALSEARKAAMIDLAFNLGMKRLGGFVKFLMAMSKSDWETAGKELESSKWFSQVKSRGPEIVNLITKEEWP